MMFIDAPFDLEKLRLEISIERETVNQNLNSC